MMIKLVREKGTMLLIFLLFCFIIEFVTFCSIKIFPVANYFFLDLIMLSFLASVIFLIKSNRISFLYLLVLIIGLLVLFLANSTLYSVFGDVFSIEYMQLLKEAGEVFRWSFLKPWTILVAIAILLAFILVNIVIINRNNNEYSSRRCYPLNGMLFIVPILVFLAIIFDSGLILANKATIVNNRKVNEETFVTNLTKKAISHYGMLTVYYKEIAIITGNYEMDDGSVILSSDNTNTNSQYNGLLKGKNVITVMAESLQEFAVSEALTPNIYSIREKGINFTNNYSVNKTNNSEQIGISGSAFSFDNDKEYNIDFALPNMLNSEYKTSFFHDNRASFYSRDKNLKYFGFENMYFHDDIYDKNFKNEIYPDGLTKWNGDSWGWDSGNYTLDSVTMSRILPKMISNTEKFYSFWTTLSTHGPYQSDEISNTDLFEKLGYYDKIDEAIINEKWTNPFEGVELYEDYLRYYQAAVMNLDEAIGMLMNELEKRNLMDDTVIVLYGDHHVYYHDIYLRMAETNDVREVDKLYKTPLYIYNTELVERYKQQTNIDFVYTFSSPYVIVPTLLDLLGVNFDNRKYINYSIFDSRYIQAFYSTQQRAYMNDLFYTTDCENISYRSQDYFTSNESAFLDDCVLLLDRLFYVNDCHDKCVLD